MCVSVWQKVVEDRECKSVQDSVTGSHVSPELLSESPWQPWAVIGCRLLMREEKSWLLVWKKWSRFLSWWANGNRCSLKGREEHLFVAFSCAFFFLCKWASGEIKVPPAYLCIFMSAMCLFFQMMWSCQLQFEVCLEPGRAVVSLASFTLTYCIENIKTGN